MTSKLSAHQRASWTTVYRFFTLTLAVGVFAVTGCACGGDRAQPRPPRRPGGRALRCRGGDMEPTVAVDHAAVGRLRGPYEL